MHVEELACWCSIELCYELTFWLYEQNVLGRFKIFSGSNIGNANGLDIGHGEERMKGISQIIALYNWMCVPPTY